MGKGLSPRIRITAPTGATITASLAGETVTLTEKSSGVYEADVEKLGPWVVSGTKGAKTDTTVVSVDDVGVFDGKLPLVSTTLNDNDWETIAAVGADGRGADYWAIGDTHDVVLNGTVGITTYTNASYHVFIAHFNYKEQNGIYFMGFMDPTSNKVLGLCGASYSSLKSDGTKTYNLNHWGGSSSPYNTNYGGWKGSDLRYDILGSTNVAPSGYGSTPTTSRVGYDPSNYDIVNSPVSNTLMAALPSALRQNMKSFTVYTDNKGNSSTAAANVTASVDYIVLPAEYEIRGTTFYYANENEPARQEQLKFYELGNSKSVYKDTDPATDVNSWGRSPSRYSAYTFVCTLGNSGSVNSNDTRFSYALTPLLRVA